MSTVAGSAEASRHRGVANRIDYPTATRVRSVAVMLKALRKLAPSQFENLVYDLVALNGMRNAVWRTPGADSGRDIEGDVHSVDFGGHHVVSRWYVECKRHSRTIDWPTVWAKLSYADNHRADYLLIVSTAHASPRCKSEISKWNSERRRPCLRLWDAGSIEPVLLRYPAILRKYGLLSEAWPMERSLLDLAMAASKLVQAAYGHATLQLSESPALEAAAALSELLAVQLAAMKESPPYRRSAFELSEDGYPWLTVVGDPTALTGFDRFGIRAALAFLRHSCRVERLELKATTGVVEAPLSSPLLPAARTLLAELAVVSDFEFTDRGTAISFSVRGAG